MQRTSATPNLKQSSIASRATEQAGTSCTSPFWRKPAAVLALLLSLFVSLQLFLPLSSAVKIGADEDFELSKATLCLNGYKLYTQIWDDQPPLDTFIITKTLQHISHSILAPRLLTVAFSALVLAFFFVFVLRVNGLTAAACSTFMLLASPGFIELSCSCMQEIPALAPAVAALCLLWIGPSNKWRTTEFLAGALFGFALQMKLIGVVYAPLAALIVWIKMRQPEGTAQIVRSQFRRAAFSIIVLTVATGLSFVFLNYLTGNSLLLQLQQSWTSHFASAQSFEYGSPLEHTFDWTVLLKNWDTTLPALIGVILLAPRVRKSLSFLIPLAWLAITLVVFPLHQPWWAYYYIHNAVPLCWCAGAAFATMCNLFLLQGRKLHDPQSRFPANRAATGHFSHSSSGGEGRGEEATSIRASRTRKAFSKGANGGSHHIGSRDPKSIGRLWPTKLAIAAFALVAGLWMFGRIYIQAATIRSAPRLDTCLVLKEIERFKPFTTFLYCDQPIYSFHAKIPMPPHLAVTSLKRLWTGDMTNAKLAAELQDLKPGLILQANDSRQVPYQDLFDREYRLVYQDEANRLYAHFTIAKKPPL